MRIWQMHVVAVGQPLSSPTLYRKPPLILSHLCLIQTPSIFGWTWAANVGPATSTHHKKMLLATKKRSYLSQTSKVNWLSLHSVVN